MPERNQALEESAVYEEAVTVVSDAADAVNARLPDPEPASVLRGFAVADHLDDRTKAALLELAKNVI